MFGRPWTALAAILFSFELVSGKHNGQPLASKHQFLDYYYPSLYTTHSSGQHMDGPIFSKTTSSSVDSEYVDPYPPRRPPQRPPPKHPVCPPPKIIQCFPNAVLNFAGVGMKRVGEIFVNSPDTRELYLDDNEISEISPMAFNKMPRLETLSLSGNNISVDKLLWFSRHDALLKLVIDDNKRYKYNSELSEVLESLPRLQQLFLRRNNIFKFRSNLTEFAPRLSELDLSGNKIEDVAFLDQLPKTLTKLCLDDNLVSRVTADPLKNVKELFVSGNRIDELCGECSSGDHSLSLKGMDKLSRLNASRNIIDTVTSDSFRDTRNLRDLDLSANEIRSLPDDVFNDLHFLEQLRISRNLLTSVPSMCSLSSVKHLDLSFNRIAQISDNSFCRLMQLETVNLTNNHILNVDSNGFLNLPLLRILDLSSNLIDKLPLTLIDNAIQLHTLLLKNNSIVNINEFFVRSRTSLKELHLQDNPLPFFNVRYVTIHVNELRPTKKDNDAVLLTTTESSSVGTTESEY